MKIRRRQKTTRRAAGAGEILVTTALPESVRSDASGTTISFSNQSMKRRSAACAVRGACSVKRRQSLFAFMRAIVFARPPARRRPAARKTRRVID